MRTTLVTELVASDRDLGSIFANSARDYASSQCKRLSYPTLLVTEVVLLRTLLVTELGESVSD